MSKLAKALTAAAGNAGGQPDPDFNRVSLLLNGDGTDGGQNNTYTDSSSNGHTMTPAGTIEQGSVSPFGDNWSNLFGGGVGGDTLVVTNTGSTIGTGDFTIEGWFYFNGIGPGTVYTLLDGRTGADTSNLMWAQEGSGSWTIYNGAGSVISTGWTSSTFKKGQWYHIAQTRTGGESRFFVNGVRTGTIDDSSSYDSQQYTIGGRYAANGSNLTGYLSNFRIVAGTALYTANFTPPTEPLTNIAGTLVLTCQSNRFADNSTNAFTITVSGTPKVTSFSPFANSKAITLAANGGSVFVNGAGDRLTTTESLGSGDFTVEFWAYTLNAGDDAFFDTRTVNNSGSGLTFTALNSTTVRIYDSGIRLSVTGVSYLNQWVHFAVERSSGTITIYVNGTSGGSVANTTNYSDTAFSIGDSQHYGDTDAYISNFRLVKGSAVYGGNFTPPTAPLTAVTNTALLLNFEDAAIFNYAALNNIGTIGNADISTSVVKYGTGSLAFDGTGDYLTVYPEGNTNLDFGSGDFTVECWFYANSLSASSYAALMGFHNANTSEWAAYVRSNGVFFYGSAATLTGSGTVNTSTWHHFAASRSGSIIRVFLDGTQVDSGLVSGTYITGGLLFRVGEDNNGTNPAFNGYIDDLRITKGLARYTSTFTPPEAALPTF
jgi:hypothetical protein